MYLGEFWNESGTVLRIKKRMLVLRDVESVDYYVCFGNRERRRMGTAVAFKRYFLFSTTYRETIKYHLEMPNCRKVRVGVSAESF